jgi:hypothetical protein
MREIVESQALDVSGTRVTLRKSTCMGIRLSPALLCALVVAIFAMPPTSVAASGRHGGCTTANSPAGNSAADEYSEVVPGACGPQSPGTGTGHGSLPPGTTSQLDSLGPDGAAAATLAVANAPAGARGGPGGVHGGGTHGSGNPGGAGDHSGASTGDSNGSWFSGLFRALGGQSDQGGLGWLLPAILGVTLLAGLMVLLARRRTV